MKAIAVGIIVGLGLLTASAAPITEAPQAVANVPLAKRETVQLEEVRSIVYMLLHCNDHKQKTDVLKLLVEGGADVAGRFHRAGLVDRYVVYLAPALLGGEDGRPLMAGPGAPTMADLRRGRFVAVEVLGDDLRLDLVLGDR